MAFDYKVMKTKVRNNFNNMYKDNSKIEKIPEGDLSYSQLATYLREALYYEVYPDANQETLKKAPQLNNDPQATEFINILPLATEPEADRKYALIKMILMIKNFSKDDTYDMTPNYTTEMANDLQKVLKELPSLQPNQTIFTINALFSNCELILTHAITPQRLKIRQIQQRVNKYFTATKHLQLAYEFGVFPPNGRPGPEIAISTPGNYVYRHRLSLALSLMYQDIIGFAPLILIGQPISNALPISTDSRAVQCIKNAYYIKYKKELITNNPSEQIIRDVFEWTNSKVTNLRMNSLAHLMLNEPEVVQAFYLDTQNPNKYTIYTLQYVYNKQKHGYTDEIKTGHFNPHQSDDWYHTARCIFEDDYISLDKSISAHSQTLAPVNKDHTKFLIGLDNNHSKKPIDWAMKLGIISINNNTYNSLDEIPYLYGFEHRANMNIHRLEAITDLDHDLLTIQYINTDHELLFEQYKLSDVLRLLKLHHSVPITACREIGSTFISNSDSDYIKSFQGFAYDYNHKKLIISSQKAPTKFQINIDQTLFLPNYGLSKNPGLRTNYRTLYVVPWENTAYKNWKVITLTNIQGTSIQEAINQQVPDGLKPIQYGTELEGNMFYSNNSIYQLIVYHWSDYQLIAQPNDNALVKIDWDDLP